MNAGRTAEWTLAAAVSLAAIVVASPSRALAKGHRSDDRSARKVRRRSEAAAKTRSRAVETRTHAARRKAEAAAKTAARARSAHRRRSDDRASGRRHSIGHRGRRRRPRGRVEVRRRPGHRWVPGHEVTRVERVLVEPAHYEYRTRQIEVVPGRWEIRRTEPVTETLYDSRGNPHEVVLAPGREEKVWIPPVCATRQVKVHVPDRYEVREVRVWVPGRWERVSQPRGGMSFSLGALFRF